MLKALMTAAVLATSMVSASAYSDASDPSPPPLGAKPAAEKSTRMKLQAGADTVKVRAVYSPNIRPNPPQAFTSANDEPGTRESGWRSYGMLLATLVLMGVIAVRRYKAGRP
jgi:hypothetical protein